MEFYQTVVLGSRQAWQFTKLLTVKILSYEPEENQVNVEMLAAGRFLWQRLMARWQGFCGIAF